MAPSAQSHPTPLPRISVITVVRNGEQFIGQTIESVLSQHYADIEYIVIDGGSTDGTVDVIKSYEARIARWISEKDEGIADAFNKGFSFSKGDYVLFLNADDALANPEVIEIVAKTIVANDFPMLLYGDCNYLDRGSGEVLFRASIDVPHEQRLLGAMIPQPSLFTHRSYFEKYGLFDSDFKIGMDYEWLLRGGLTERIVHVPSLVTNVRDGGISTLDRKCVVDEIISALKKHGYVTSKSAELEIRGYYLARSFAKSILKGMGLYGAFCRFRSWRGGRD